MCAPTCIVRKKAQREEMDRQGGREGEGAEDDVGLGGMSDDAAY